MRVLLVVAGFLATLASTSTGRAVEVTEAPRYLADVSVYVTDEEYLAECTIFVVAEAALADGNELWFWQDSDALADVSVFLTDDEHLADYTIAYTDSEATADCDIDWAAGGE